MFGKFKVLLDTNALTIPGKYKVDIFRELEKFGNPEFYVLDIVIGELEKLREKGGQDAKYAKLGFELINKEKVKIILATGKCADTEMVKLASKGFVVCTQDAGLKKRIRAKKKPVVSLRQGRYLIKN